MDKNKGGRPGEAKEAEDKLNFIPRDDIRYKRIEEYHTDNLVNNLIFEFYLRDKEFKQTLNNFDKTFNSFISTDDNEKPLIMTSNYKNHEYKSFKASYLVKFKRFGYFVDDIEKYCFYKYAYTNRVEGKETFTKFRHIMFAGDYITNHDKKVVKKHLAEPFNRELSNLMDNMDIYYNVLYKEDDKVYFKFLETRDDYFITSMYNYNLPEFRIDYMDENKGDTFPLKHITVNLMNSKQSTLNQINEILEKLYKDRGELNYEYSLSKIAYKQNIQEAFANYFYIYDNSNKEVRNELIARELGIYKTTVLKQKSMGSVKTVKSVYDKMKKYIDDKSFIYFYLD